MRQFRFCLLWAVSVSRDLFVFVLFCRAFLFFSFLKGVLNASCGFSCFVLLLLWGFLSLLNTFFGSSFLGLSPLAPLSCRSLLFHVSCGFFLFWLLLFSVIFSLWRRRAPFSLLWATLSVVVFVCIFFVGPSSTQLFPYWFCSHQFAELGSIHCLAFSARACYLAFPCLAIPFLEFCRAVSWYTCFFFSGWCLGRSLYWFCWFFLRAR